MKTDFVVQYGDNKEYKRTELEEAIVKKWTDEGNKSSDLKSLKVYFKQEENKAYYVINDVVDGCIEL